MKISYAITVCNEHKEIERLLTFLFEHKRPEDQVVVQMDMNATEEVLNVCEKWESKPHNEYSLNQFEISNHHYSFYLDGFYMLQNFYLIQIDLMNIHYVV